MLVSRLSPLRRRLSPLRRRLLYQSPTLSVCRFNKVLLFEYPSIRMVLTKLTEDQASRSQRAFTKYICEIEMTTEADNIAEELLLVYNLVDSKNGLAPNEALIHLLQGASSIPRPLVALLIIRACERAALDFEETGQASI